MKHLLASLAALLILASGASACLNDSELPGHEREFRSSYKRQIAPAPEAPSEFLSDAVPVVLGSGGGLFLIGAGIVALRRTVAKG